GQSCIRHLMARGYAVVGVDTRPQPPKLDELRREFPGLELHAGGMPAALFDRPGLLVVSPGVSLKEPVIARAIAQGTQPIGEAADAPHQMSERTSETSRVPASARGPRLVPIGEAADAPSLARGPRLVPIGEAADAPSLARGPRLVPIGDIELFARALRERLQLAPTASLPVLAITGANGKSTVTAMTGAICVEAGLLTQVGGNIGTPALDLLAGNPAQSYVLELSSFQLETTWTLNPLAATVLNITPDHMDRYADLDEYAAAKARIFRGDGVLVLNADDPRVMAMKVSGRRVIRFGLDRPATSGDYGLREHGGETWLARGDSLLMPASEVPLPGRHNLANALAAIALAQTLGVSDAHCRAAMRAFRGLPHRTELVAEIDGVRWINDSKGTNVGATVAALAGMTAPVVLIAGGDGKGQDFGPLRAPLAEHGRALVLIGRDASLIRRAVGDAVPLHEAADLPAAVGIARTLARRGDIVLLSPACASFDMFRNYQHRGDVFRAVVRALPGERT
ncbi:MAG: UDP-N-acetylmuramoyl-L-alanine--D-glutamate ligase, partial [Pseudomonadota bacterium]